MRFPHPDFEKVCFIAEDADLLIKIVGPHATTHEQNLIFQYANSGLPPVISPDVLAAMFGFNPGFIWSMLKRPHKHYRTFELPKGKNSTRTINAPKVGLKAIQYWLAKHWSMQYQPKIGVYGFIPGKSHADAAKQHLNSEWVVSLDISNFFPSVAVERIQDAIDFLGYKDEGSQFVLPKLLSLEGGLTQGSPTSPVISNIALRNLDERLQLLSSKNSFVFTRYADDIVFSGKGNLPIELSDSIKSIITDDGWTVAEKKTHSSKLPRRLKVHGLLVHGEELRLTKGYRNRVRAYRHLINSGKVAPEDIGCLSGHIAYANFIEHRNEDGTSK